MIRQIAISCVAFALLIADALSGRSRHVNVVRILVVLLGVAMLAIGFSGCAVPSTVRAEWEHVSHPFAGPPFGPENEEDTLDTLNVISRWQRGRLYAETGIGYRLVDGGFYGPDLTFTSRVGIEFSLRDSR